MIFSKYSRYFVVILLALNVALAPASSKAAEAIKVGIVGNSHLEALRLALTAYPERYDDLDISFWGMPGGAMAELTKVDASGVLSAAGGPNRALEKLTGNPTATFDPRNFDVVVIYGYSLAMGRYLRKFAAMAKDGGVPEAARMDEFSKELSSRFAFEYAKSIQRLGKRVILYTAPYSSYRIAHRRSTRTAKHVPEAIELARKTAKDAGAEFYAQPAETVKGDYYTDTKYAAADDDNRHMNAEYGAIALDYLAEIIRH